MPLRPLVLLTTLLHAYIGLRLLPALAGLPLAGPLLGLALLVSAVTMPLPFVGMRSQRRQFADVWKWIGLISMGWFSSLLLLTVLRDAALLLGWLGTSLSGATLDGARWRLWSAAAVPLA